MGYVELFNGVENPNKFNGHCVGTAEIQGFTQHGIYTNSSINKHCSVLIENAVSQVERLHSDAAPGIAKDS